MARITEAELAEILLQYTPHAARMAHNVFTHEIWWESERYTHTRRIGVGSNPHQIQVVLMMMNENYEQYDEIIVADFRF